MSRRQNSSCDQCRKGKRACDAVWLRDRQIQRATVDAGALRPAIPSHGGLDDEFDFVGPCTNCSRTNKQCTFEWVQSQQLQRRERQQALASTNPSTTPAPSSRKGQVLALATDSPSAGSQPSTPSSLPLRTLRPSIATFDPPPHQQRQQHQQQHQPQHHQPQPYPASSSYPAQHSVAAAPDQQMLLNGCAYPTSAPPEPFELPHPVADVAFVDASLTTTAPPMVLAGAPCLGLDTTGEGGAGVDAGGADPAQNHSPFSMNLPNVLADYSLTPFTAHSAYTGFGGSGSVSRVWSSPATSAATAPDELVHMRKRRRTQSPAARCLIATTPWDIMGDNRLTRATNGFMISDTMMRIYHDVMEGALSCWLTEQTCPYNSVATPPPLTNIPNRPHHQQNQTHHHHQQQQQQAWSTLEDMQREWGPNWSNRIYRRVVKLDRMAHLLGLRRLSPADERRVSSALNAAVMAFTAQWSHASRRSCARWPPPPVPPPVPDPSDLELGEEFDRTLQKSFWHQARKALDDCGEIDSFRVVFAEIIFGLTQKYTEALAQRRREEDELDEAEGLGGDSGSVRDSSTSQVIEDILREDTQQVWLERATRRLHVLRRRIELYDRQLRNRNEARDRSCYDAECRKTIDLLFWLAVMFDTISAAMTERPLTVADEDTSNLALAHPSHHSAGGTLPTRDTAKRWNVILAKDQQTKFSSLRWPCTDAEIAQELSDAAPVKVLLYRKVTRLQTLTARDLDPSTIEEAIDDSLMVYRHWQAIYGRLFVDCIENHLLLPARIQSWYVCLFGHWLLATMLLVDLIEIVDQRGLGSETAARRRRDEGTVTTIRMSSARLVSDLARAATPRHDDQGELENFHHAINEGALLTEPWTMILLRTFSRASIVFLEKDDDDDEDDPSRSAKIEMDMTGPSAEEDRGRHERCEDCIRALWYLGRKSDMAREVANVLSGTLQRARFKMGLGYGHP